MDNEQVIFVVRTGEFLQSAQGYIDGRRHAGDFHNLIFYMTGRCLIFYFKLSMHQIEVNMLCSPALADAKGFNEMKQSEHESPFFKGQRSIEPSCALHRLTQCRVGMPG